MDLIAFFQKTLNYGINMTRTFLTPQEKNKIHELLLEGKLSMRQIAKHIGRPQGTVFSYLDRCRRGYTSRKQVQIPFAVVHMYVVDKMTIREIMDATGGSYGGIHRKLQANGVQMRKRGKNNR